jgi:hypothetical protein
MSDSIKSSRRAIVQLILFLLLILIVFVLYGLKTTPLVLGEEIKQFGVKALFKEQESKVEQIVLDTIVEVAQDNTKTNVKRDSSSKFILLTGDSMVEQLRYRMEEIAHFNGHKLMACIWYNSTTKKWSKTNRLSDLYKEYRPDVVIFTLGANELSLPNIKSREPFIKDMIAEIDSLGIPFVWIGPPNWLEDTGLNNMVEQYIGEKRFYHSAHLEDELVDLRQEDGAHPTREGADLWADSINIWLTSQSFLSDKLLFERPELAAFEAKTYQPENNSVCRKKEAFSVRILKKNYRPRPCVEEISSDSTKIQ